MVFYLVVNNLVVNINFVLPKESQKAALIVSSIAFIAPLMLPGL